MSGDAAKHDAMVASALKQLSQQVDVIVLAQASMARVLPRLSEAAQGKVLTSPRLGMMAVQQALS